MRVAVRVDASPLIGGGHAMRCMTLADALAERGAQVTFVSAAMPEALGERIAMAGHKLVRIPRSPELEREGRDWHKVPLSADAQAVDCRATAEATRPADWLIVDHYLLDSRWHAASRTFARRLLAIDDLANRQYDCDLLLDQTFGRSAEDYDPLLPDGAVQLIGPDFALLRPEFPRERPSALARRRANRPVERILVSLGTTDPGNITATILRQVLEAAPECAVDVVLGAQAAADSHVPAIASENPRVTVHVSSTRMAELMRDSDLAIGAAGATSWERCCLGLPAIVIVLADNQQLIAEGLAKAGAHVTVDAADSRTFAEQFRLLLGSGEARSRMSERAAAISDGQGTQRVVQALDMLEARERLHG